MTDTSSQNMTYIIVTWNNQNEIRDCLDSIIKWSSEQSRIIVLDNASSDDTVNIINKDYSQVDFVEIGKNLGFAVANNLGLEKTTSEFVCFINPDVILTENIEIPSIQYLESHNETGLVACRLKNLDMTLQPSCFEFASRKNLVNEILHKGRFAPQFICRRKYINYYKAKKTISVPWVIGAEMIMRTRDAKQIGGFSTEYYMYTEDMDLCRKISDILHKNIVYMPDYSLIHLGGASESQNFKYNKQKKLFENDLLFINKFDGQTEKEETLKSMIKAYKKRIFILKYFYVGSNKKTILDKSRKSLEILNQMMVM